MDGRAFLDVSRDLARRATEAHRRAAAGRAYYALMIEARDRLIAWGFPKPSRDRSHDFARLKFLYSGDSALKDLGITLERLGQLRRRADYDMNASRDFAGPSRVDNAIDDATDAIASLDHIDADPSRRSAAIAAIRP